MDSVHAGGLGGTYGGNPVACAAALGAIGWMEANDANGLAKAIEGVMLPRLKAMAERYPAIGDIRGRGAMIAIELVKPGTMDPDADLAGALNKHCHMNGVVTLTTGHLRQRLPLPAAPHHAGPPARGGADDPRAGLRGRHPLTVHRRCA